MLQQIPPTKESLPGFWQPNPRAVTDLIGKGLKVVKYPKDILVLKNVLSEIECKNLINLMDLSPNFEEVSIQGKKDKDDTTYNAGVGSKRTSIWSEELSNQIWDKLKSFIEPKFCDDLTPTDWYQLNGSRVWKPYSLSPLLRFMEYQKNGQHYAHYDAGYIYPDSSYRTLKSVVIYLTTSEKDGQTRFIKDGQETIPVYDRNHNDWDREVRPEEVEIAVKPSAGDILIFDHRLCHDVEKYTGNNPRIIIRTDIIYNQIS